MTISTLGHIDGFGCSFKWTMQLDFDATPQLPWNGKVSPVNMHITTNAVLSQLKGVPLVWLFEAREAYSWATIRLPFVLMVQKELKGLIKTIRYSL